MLGFSALGQLALAKVPDEPIELSPVFDVAFLVALALASGWACTVRSETTWSRQAVAETAWACVTPQVAESCEDEVATPEGADVLAYVDGDIFVDVDGYQLRFIG